jgi:hypothetical protein
MTNKRCSSGDCLPIRPDQVERAGRTLARDFYAASLTSYMLSDPIERAASPYSLHRFLVDGPGVGRRWLGGRPRR